MTLKTNYRAGMIVRVSSVNGWTLGSRGQKIGVDKDTWLRECPTPLAEHYHYSFEKFYDSYEGKVALIVNVVRNRLDQPMGYRVQIGNEIWFCKSVVADKYFELVGDQNNVASRTTGEVQDIRTR